MANRFLNNIKINDEYTLPPTDGTADQVIKTDGAGNLSFVDATALVTTAESGLVYYDVKNSTGGAINKGKAVRAVGTNGNSGHILIDEMIADGSVESKYFMGILETTLNNGDIGRVIHFGEIDQFNTLGQNGETWNDGDLLWLDPSNNGDYTITEPNGPNIKVAAAIVVNAATNGKIFTRVQANEGVHDLHDVLIQSLATGHILVYDATTDVWKNSSQSTDAALMPSGTEAQRPTPTAGMIRFNTTANEFEGYNGTEWAPIGGTGSAGIDIDNFTGNSSEVNFTLSSEIQEEDNTQVYIDGVYQSKSNYTTSGTTLTFSTPPPTGASIEVVNFTSISESQMDGSGTTNYVTKWLDSDTLTDSVVYDDGTNVGIGTANPDTKLHSFGTGDVAKFETTTFGGVNFSRENPVGNHSTHFVNSFNNADSEVAYIKTLNRTGATTSTGTGYELQFATAGSGYQTFYTNNTERMRIHSGGDIAFRDTSANEAFYWDASAARLGIGTDSPNANLHILNGVTGASLKLSATSTAYWQIQRDPITGNLNISDDALGNVVSFDQLTGNVGIGTDSPSAGIHVKHGSITTSSNYSSFLSNASAKIVSNHSSEYGISIGYANDSTDTIGIQSGNTSASRPLSLQPYGGNVGIGTTSPSAKLHVFKSSHPNTMLARFENPSGEALVEIKAQNDALSVLQFADSEDGNVGAIQYSHPENSMRFKTADAERMRITSGGDVKISTNGNFLQGVRNTGSATINMIGFGEATDELQITGGTSGGANAISFYDTAGFLGTWYNSNFGIGVTNPSTPLQVNGVAQIVTGIDTAFYEGDGVRMFGTQWYRFRNSGGNVRALISVNTGNLSLYNSSNVLTNLIATDGNSYFNGGNVGIGTTSPSTELHVKAPSGYAELRLQGASGSGSTVEFYDDATKLGDIYIDPSKNIVFRNASERMRITSAGAIHLSQGSGNAFVGTDAGNLGTSTGTYNSGFGNSSLFSNTTGGSNTANGYASLYNNTTGVFNTANGRSSLIFNTTGDNNTANGYAALFSNTTASNNTANGVYALYSNTTGTQNTANGVYALYYNTTASNNTANGYSALYFNTTGTRNTASGYAALYQNTEGYNNTAIGYTALENNTTGIANTATGFQALESNSTGNYNTANGAYALQANSTGTYNTAIGLNSLQTNTTGYQNTANGYAALKNNTTGYYNTAYGAPALFSNTTGALNTATGYNALNANTTGNYNTAIGNYALSATTTGGNNTGVGYNAQASSAIASNEVILGNSSVTTLICNTQTITALSDIRDKKDIKELQGAEAFIKELKPVSFVWNQRDGGRVDIDDNGFIAQDLIEAQEKSGHKIPNLVLENNPEKLEAAYGAMLPSMVSALQSALKKIELLETEIETLKNK